MGPTWLSRQSVAVITARLRTGFPGPKTGKFINLILKDLLNTSAMIVSNTSRLPETEFSNCKRLRRDAGITRGTARSLRIE